MLAVRQAHSGRHQRYDTEPYSQLTNSIGSPATCPLIPLSLPGKPPILPAGLIRIGNAKLTLFIFDVTVAEEKVAAAEVA